MDGYSAAGGPLPDDDFDLDADLDQLERDIEAELVRVQEMVEQGA